MVARLLGGSGSRWGWGEIKSAAPRSPPGLSEKLALLKESLLVISNISSIPGCQIKGICRHSAVGC